MQISVYQHLSHKQIACFFHVDLISWNTLFLVIPAEFFKSFKPFFTALYAVSTVIFADFMYAVLFVIPILVQKPCKKLLHSHLFYAVHIKLRKHACNIVQQNVVTAYNVEILRSEIISIII